jgi:putative membrane protein
MEMDDTDRSSAEPGDASRRTRLANERTYLAWWRTGLTSLAVSIGAGRVVPALTDEAQWPYTVIGVGFALLGIGLIAYASARRRQVELALARGDFAHPNDLALAAFTGIGIVLGLLVLAIVVGEN